MTTSNNDETCMLCKRKLRLSSTEQSLHWRDCDSCGIYLVTSNAAHYIQHELLPEEHFYLSCIARERQIRSDTLCLCMYYEIGDSTFGQRKMQSVTEAIDRFPKRMHERFDRVLSNLCVLTSVPGEIVEIDLETDLPILMAGGLKSANFILSEMCQLNFISPDFGNGTKRFSITVRAAGIDRARQLGDPSSKEEYLQGFVAMSFDESMNEPFAAGIAPAIMDTGFIPLRIDAKQTNQKICDEIIAEIKRSRFVVADFTGHRGGVYFEAGFALGLGIPVIWTCRNDCIDDAHFDTRQYAHILWDSPDDLYNKLAKRIAATIPGSKLPDKK